MKKIEKGCTAVVIGNVPENVGKIVTVGNFVGNVKLEIQGHKNVRLIGDDVWEIDKPIKAESVNNKKIYGYFPYCRERYLQRIDDDSETEDGESSVKEIERED